MSYLDSSSKTGYDNKAYYPAPGNAEPTAIQFKHKHFITDEVIDASDLSMMTLKGQIPVKAEVGLFSFISRFPFYHSVLRTYLEFTPRGGKVQG